MKSVFKNGWDSIKTYSKLWVILWLLVLFPAVFVFTFYDIYSASRDNVRSVELQQIATLHDTLESLVLSQVPLDTVLANIASQNETISSLKVAKEDTSGLRIIADAEPELVGQSTKDTSTYRLALLQPGETYITQVEINGAAVDHAYRYLALPEGGVVIFSAHDFTKLQAVLASRVVNSVFALFFIFLFILGLAYWIARQINYQKLYLRTKDTLKERDLFANSLAHELRSPVTAIRGYASLLNESGLSEENKSYVETITLSTSRLLALINDFLEAARIQSGAVPVELSRINLLELVQGVVTELQPTATTKGLLLETKFPHESVLLNSDQKRLTQVFTNILSNSIKYTAKGKVSISVIPRRNQVDVTIADTGFGISAEDQRKLFAPFARLGNSSQQQSITGTGLGMWITKQLVEQLNGTIEIESIKDVGTHVHIILQNKTT